MAAEKTPVLAGAIPTLERFMSRWEWLAQLQEDVAPAIRAGLDVAYRYYSRMDSTDVYIISMCEYYLPSSPLQVST